MKSLYQFSVLFLLVSLWSCEKKENVQTTVDYTIQVQYPDTYSQQKAVGAEVKITNSFTGEEKTARTDAEGEAKFTGLLPGMYQISATRDLDPAEALLQVGIEGEIYLSASLTNHNIQEEGSVSISLKGSSPGGWVIKQIYYTGAANTTNFSNDQFVELYNNSAEVLYADGLSIGDIVGRPYVSSSSVPSGFASDTEYVYFQNIFTVPGDGERFPVEPGESFLIARSAINHKSDPTLGNPNSPVDLGKGIADAEVYWEQAGRDTDNPDVPNMTVNYFHIPTTFDWFPTVFGPSIVIFRHDNIANLPRLREPGTTRDDTYPQVPVSSVIDAIDCVRNASVGHFKRLPSNVDAGFQYCTNSYTSEALRRKVKTEINGRKVLQDTNNSTNDFERVTPPKPKGW